MLFRSTPAPTDTPAEVRRRPLDNPRVLTVAACLLVAILVALFWLASRTSDIALPLLTDVLLYVLIALDFVLLASLGFVLARSLLKLWVEQRQAAPFARFRGKLVAALLAMTIVPSVLVLISGSTIIRDSAERWFSEPVDDVLSAAQEIAREYYAERQGELTLRAQRLARIVAPATIAAADVAELSVLVSEEPKSLRDGLVEVYRTIDEPGRPLDVEFVFSAQSTLPKNLVHASADRLAARTVVSLRSENQKEDLPSGVTLLRSAAPIVDGDGAPAGVVVVSQVLSSDVRTKAVAATAAYESYQKKRVLKGPLRGIYQSVFLAISLLILMSATWLGLYLAKRITRPVQMLADSARAIGAGQLDLPRLEPEAGDELGSLVESFNMMAAELRTSRERIEQSRRDLQQKNLEVDARRRYIETILERVATGVISLDAEGRISTVNGAAERLLGLDASTIGQPIASVFQRDDLSPLLPLVDTSSPASLGVVHEITLAREGREVHLAAAATVLGGESGRRDGVVFVLDDVTPLIRAQRVAAWRDVARRLAHEIKNPLTPIQLSAERMRRHFSGAPEQTLAFVSECTGAIITEVEALKNLVDEFAQFARLRGPRMLRTDVNRLIEDTIALYGGVLQQGALRVQQRLAPGLPAVRLDAEQMRQVIINLVDNAMEALGGRQAGPRPDGAVPTIVVSTAHDARSGVVRIVVSDNGPGVPPEDRDKLFMPYYSTKGRGSGLGLAIVRRIIVEHGGNIQVGPMLPSGTVFTIEMPEV
jgi:two-component system nitrogen regulation sensor histidine kinase NtrY